MSNTHAVAFCAECGAAAEQGAEFCGSCGEPIYGAPDVTRIAAVSSTAQSQFATQMADPGASPQGVATQYGSPASTVPPQGYHPGFVAPAVPVEPDGSKPRKSNPNTKFAFGALGALGAALIIGAVLLVMNLTGGDSDTQASPAPTTGVTGGTAAGETLDSARTAADSTVIEADQANAPAAAMTSSVAVPSAPVDVSTLHTLHSTEAGFGGTYDKASAITSVTSASFTRAVARAYANSGAQGSTTLSSVYSPVTGRSYTMRCNDQGNGSVICSGGNNASVLLYN